MGQNYVFGNQPRDDIDGFEEEPVIFIFHLRLYFVAFLMSPCISYWEYMGGAQMDIVYPGRLRKLRGQALANLREPSSVFGPKNTISTDI